MNTYTYQALTCKGEQTEGTVNAKTEAEAILDLRKQGLYPTQIRLGGSTPPVEKIVSPPAQSPQTITLGPSFIFASGVIIGALLTYLCIGFLS